MLKSPLGHSRVVFWSASAEFAPVNCWTKRVLQKCVRRTYSHGHKLQTCAWQLRGWKRNTRSCAPTITLRHDWQFGCHAGTMRAPCEYHAGTMRVPCVYLRRTGSPHTAAADSKADLIGFSRDASLACKHRRFEVSKRHAEVCWTLDKALDSVGKSVGLCCRRG